MITLMLFTPLLLLGISSASLHSTPPGAGSDYSHKLTNESLITIFNSTGGNLSFTALARSSHWDCECQERLIFLQKILHRIPPITNRKVSYNISMNDQVLNGTQYSCFSREKVFWEITYNMDLESFFKEQKTMKLHFEYDH